MRSAAKDNRLVLPPSAEVQQHYKHDKPIASSSKATKAVCRDTVLFLQGERGRGVHVVTIETSARLLILYRFLIATI